MKIPKIHIPKIKIKDPISFADKAVSIGGIVCIFTGIYQIYKPVAWIILGVILAWPGIPKIRR